MTAFFDDWDTPVRPQAITTPATIPAITSPPRQANSPASTVTPTAPASRPDPAVPATDPRPGALAPVRTTDKRIVNGKGDINQLAPFKYPWAWEFFLNANKNHWTPLEISMAQDVHDYHHRLTPAERHVFENVLSYLTTSDILAMRNIGLAVMEKMSAPELQIYQARQVYEEALHTWTYQHCIESLGLDQQEIYNRYRVVPEIHGKIALANRRLERVMRADFDLTDRDNLHEFALSYLFFAAIFEGCWFYNGFTPIFALQRRGLMKGTAEQLQYIIATLGSAPPNASAAAREPTPGRLCCSGIGSPGLSGSAGLHRLQRESLVVRLAQALGANGITVGLVEELLIERRACRRRRGRAVGGVGPLRVGADSSGDLSLGLGGHSGRPLLPVPWPRGETASGEGHCGVVTTYVPEVFSC